MTVGDGAILAAAQTIVCAAENRDKQKQGLAPRETLLPNRDQRQQDFTTPAMLLGYAQYGSFKRLEPLYRWLGFLGSTAMAGVPAGLPTGVRVSDHISLGVIAKAFPPDRVRQVLAETGKASERERDLPAHVMVYYAIAMALYMGSSTREVLRCLLEGLRWLWGADAVKVAGKSGISQARSRLGETPLRRLYEQVVQRWRRAPPRGRGIGRGGW